VCVCVCIHTHTHIYFVYLIAFRQLAHQILPTLPEPNVEHAWVVV